MAVRRFFAGSNPRIGIAHEGSIEMTCFLKVPIVCWLRCIKGWNHCTTKIVIMFRTEVPIVRSFTRLKSSSIILYALPERYYSINVAPVSNSMLKLQKNIQRLGADTMENPKEFCITARKIKNILMARPENEFKEVKTSLTKSSQYPDIISMLLHTHLNNPGEQYNEFVRTIRGIISGGQSNNNSIQHTMKQLYIAIYCQRQVFPTLKEGSAIVLPDDVHKWFYENIDKADSFQHYYFLIQNDISLASSLYIRKFTTRLLQGSETERQLATFEYFLKRPEIYKTRDQLTQKFVSLHSFHDLYTFTNIALNNKEHSKNNPHLANDDFIKFYLQSVLQKIVYYKAHTDRQGKNNDKALAIQFTKLVIQLLMIVSKEGNVKQFTSVLSTLMAFMKSNPNIDEGTYQKMMHKPIVCMFSLLRRNKNPDAVFSLANQIGSMDGIKNSYILKTLVINEIMRSLRYFNDPKIACQFLVSSIALPDLDLLLNDLGVWGSVFHSSGGLPIEQTIVKDGTSQMTPMVPSTLRAKPEKLSIVLSEVYKTLLSTNAIMMKPDEYKRFLMRLYTNYITVMEERSATQYMWKHNTLVLKCFISHAINTIGDKNLVLDILLNFYSKPFSKKVRNHGRDDPFAMVLYNDQTLTKEQVSTVLKCMDERNVPFTFKLCSSMVFRYLGWGEVKTAHEWYRKILESKFPLAHSPLIRAAHDNLWELPENIDTNLLLEQNSQQQNIATGASDTLSDDDDMDILIDEQDEVSDADIRDLFALAHKM